MSNSLSAQHISTNLANYEAARTGFFSLIVDDSILIKTRDTRSQANLTRKERVENLKDSFAVVDKSKVKGKIILVVDDVFTTGSTINECSKTLLDAGAKAVYSITVAHADTKVLVAN